LGISTTWGSLPLGEETEPDTQRDGNQEDRDQDPGELITPQRSAPSMRRDRQFRIA